MDISREGEFHQVITFDYIDHKGGYQSRVSCDREFYAREMALLQDNMQEFLDEEANYINGARVYPKVTHADIEFRDLNRPFHFWVIEFQGHFKPGQNIYRSEIPVDPPLAYPVHSIYHFPRQTRILHVKTQMDVTRLGNLLLFWAEPGQVLGPVEEFVFEIREKNKGREKEKN